MYMKWKCIAIDENGSKIVRENVRSVNERVWVGNTGNSNFLDNIDIYFLHRCCFFIRKRYRLCFENISYIMKILFEKHELVIFAFWIKRRQ